MRGSFGFYHPFRTEHLAWEELPEAHPPRTLGRVPLHAPLHRSTLPAPAAVPGRLAALGRACYRHRRWVLALWVAVLTVGVLIGGRVFEGTVAGTSDSSSEAAGRTSVVAAADPSAGTVTAVVDGALVDTPAVRNAVTVAAGDLAKLPGVVSVSDAYQGGAQATAQRSADGSASLVTVKMAQSSTSKQQSAVTTRLGAINAPGTHVTVGGDLVLQQEVKNQTQSDTKFGEIVTLPLTLIVMVLVFGGLAAASLPVIGAIASVGGALLAMFGFSQIMSIDTSVLPIATVLGLGLSIDYALLMVNRFREERGHGAAIAAAVERTAATAGRTVAFSGLTVAVALSGLFVFSSPVFRAVAAAGVSVVVIAVAAALTLIPALLGFAGHRIKPPKKTEPDEGFFARTVRRVQRRAVPVALICVTLLMAAGAPSSVRRCATPAPRCCPPARPAGRSRRPSRSASRRSRPRRSRWWCRARSRPRRHTRTPWWPSCRASPECARCSRPDRTSVPSRCW